jgi:hypothetical protein
VTNPFQDAEEQSPLDAAVNDSQDVAQTAIESSDLQSSNLNLDPLTQNQLVYLAKVNLGELTRNQLIYLAAYVIVHAILLIFCPLLVLACERNEFTFCLGIGLLHGVAVNSSTWSVFGDVNVLIRMPMGIFVALLCCLSFLAMYLVDEGTPGPVVLLMSAMPFVVFMLLQVPFWLLRRALAWRLRFSRPHLIPDQMQVRFSIKHLFITVTVAAVLTGGIRTIAFVLPIDEESLFVLHLILAGTGIGAVTVVCCLVNEHLTLVLIGGIVLNIAITIIEIGTWDLTLQWSIELAYLIALINIATMAVVATSFLSIRPVGLRLWTIRDSLSA